MFEALLNIFLCLVKKVDKDIIHGGHDKYDKYDKYDKFDKYNKCIT